MEPIDPANTSASLELIHTRWERAMEKWKNIQTKDDDKITHIIFGGRFPFTSKMSINSFGELTAGATEAVDLTMSSLDWQKKGLPSMGKNLINVSLNLQDLSGDLQANKAKQASSFLDMPREVLNTLTDDVYNVVSE